MARKTPKTPKKWTLEQTQAIAWFALPKALRVPPTQQALAPQIGVHQDSITDWKKLPGWWDAVNNAARASVKEVIADVLGVMCERAIRGELPYVHMVLAMAGMGADIEAAGKGPPPVREIVVACQADSV